MRLVFCWQTVFLVWFVLCSLYRHTTAFGPSTTNTTHPKFFCNAGYNDEPCVYIVRDFDNGGVPETEASAFVKAIVERIHLLPSNDTGLLLNDTLKVSKLGAAQWMTGIDLLTNGISHDVCERFVLFFNRAIAMLGPTNGNELICIGSSNVDIYGNGDIDGCNFLAGQLNALDLVRYSCTKDGACVPSTEGASFSDCQKACVPEEPLYVCDKGECRAAVDPERGVSKDECALLCQ